MTLSSLPFHELVTLIDLLAVDAVVPLRTPSFLHSLCISHLVMTLSAWSMIKDFIRPFANIYSFVFQVPLRLLNRSSQSGLKN